MSGVVLDTHTLVWLLAGDRRLSPAVVEVVRHATATNQAFVSAITPWEIAMLVAKNKLAFACDVLTWLDEALSQPGITLAPLLPAIAVDSVRLPGAIHGDPADRIIVATARHLRATLVTADAKLLTYGRGGHVAVLATSTADEPAE
ncbi:MAG TPA: type II toxin-antitoxin system VapC family toxin [Chloroflexota bacterium]|nr:type II toxin-antitoxin system VapC family toxin [Chloroflexota bacterium]